MGKKLISLTLAVTTFAWLFGASFVPVASAQTTADLQAQIATLLAQIAALQAQLNGGTTTTGFQFTRNLTVGMTGTDVRELQKFLNSKGFIVTVSGAGSIGNESTYFGPNTKAALMKFQAANGISATGYFGPITMAKVNSMLVVVTPPPGGTTPPPTTTPGVEGTLTAKLYASPVGVEMNEGMKDVAVLGVELEAKTSSMTVQRVDVEFATTTRPTLPFERVSLVVNGSVIATKQISSIDAFTKDTSTNFYTLRFSGLSQVIAKDSKAVITVTVSAKDDVDAAYLGSWTVRTPINGIRAVDGAGIQHEVHSAVLSRVFTLEAVNAGDLEVSLNSANKASGVVFISENSNTSDVELLAFDVKAKESNVEVTDVSVKVSSSDDDAPIIAKLYQGSTLLGSESLTMANGSSTVTFDELTVAIAKDATKTFYVKVDVNAAGSNYATVSAGATVSAALTGNIVFEYGVDETVANEAVTTAGNSMYLYFKAPVLVGGANEALTAVENNSKIAGGTLTFNVTAQGGDIYVAEASSTITSAASSTSEFDWTVSGATETSTGSNIWLISSGATATFNVPVSLNNTGAAGTAFTGAQLSVFAWGTSATTLSNSWTSSTIKMVEDTKTASILLTN